MNRAQLRDEARAALVRAAPDVAVKVAERVVESRAVQRWFDSIERRRPRGLVALVRRLRGKRRGLDEQELRELEELMRTLADKYR